MLDKKNALFLIGLVLFAVALAIGINSCWKMGKSAGESFKNSVTERP